MLFILGDGDFSQIAHMAGCANVTRCKPHIFSFPFLCAKGAIMVFAWIFFSPTAVFVASNLKFADPQWFLVHKYFQVVLAI